VADYAANTEGVRNVIRAVGLAGGVRLTVYASSRLVFDIAHRPAHDFDYHPTTAYGASKAEGERIVRSEATDASRWLLVRPTSIWGPWFGVPYRDFFEAVLRGRYVHPKGRRIRKSYGYVANSVYELLRLIEAPTEETERRVFWLADYPPIEVAAWAAEIRRRSGQGPVRSMPVSVLRAGGLAGDLLKRAGVAEPPLTTFRVNNLITEMVYDTRSTEDIVGDLPFSMEDGVRATLEWLQGPGRDPRGAGA
jgi:GlcNAc-P-P-Und epimerase